jgi:hypothetical protein
MTGVPRSTFEKYATFIGAIFMQIEKNMAIARSILVRVKAIKPCHFGSVAVVLYEQKKCCCLVIRVT